MCKFLIAVVEFKKQNKEKNQQNKRTNKQKPALKKKYTSDTDINPETGVFSIVKDHFLKTVV